MTRKPPKDGTVTAPLRRPDGTDPDGYYRTVAAAYTAAVRRGDAPAPALATEAGVPLATARGWIQEARRRGSLPPGRRGVTGETTALERVAAELDVPIGRLRVAIARHAPGGLRVRP